MRGSISKHTAKDGTVSWHVRVDTVDNATGRRRQPQRTYRTKREAEAGLQEWLTEIAAGSGVKRSTQTVADYLEWWLDSCASARVKPSTLASYRYLCGAYIIPELGAVGLQQLGAQRLQGFYACCLTPGLVARTPRPLSARTVRYLHTILHVALGEALRLGLVARNVADAVRPPRPRAPEARAWTADEVRRFLAAARDDSYWPLWLVALHTGLRQSELLGLRWRDLDLEGGRLTVQQSQVRVGSRLQIQPGAKRGGHTLRLDTICVATLRTHHSAQLARRLELGPLWEGESTCERVFTAALGRAAHPGTVGQHMKRLVAAAGVSPLSFHGLRHTHATILMHAGVHPKVVSERLGHADIAMTLRIYSHVLPDMHASAAEAFAAAVAPALPADQPAQA